VPPSFNFPQLDFVEPSSGFHPVTWERVTGNHISCSRECKKMWRNEPSLPNELSSWELESQMDSWISKSDCKGQNSMDWSVPYIIEKLLERKCLKWVRMTHLNIWNTSYNQKKGEESNGQLDSQPLKVGNHPNFLARRWRATHRWKALDKGYNFSSNFITIGGLHVKLWAPKVVGVPGTKCHLDVGLVERHKVYCKGEGGCFPQVRAMVSLVNLKLLVARPNTKSVQTMH
jgi:hypothetical protein